VPLPRKIKVGPLAYRVERAELDEYGHCDHDQFVIRLRTRMRREATQETLFHEVLHAVCEAANLDWSEADEERVVRALSPLLLDVLQRNETLRHYLFSD